MKKVISVMLATTMLVSLLSGCGGSSGNNGNTTTKAAASATTAAGAAAAAATTAGASSGKEITLTFVESLTSAERTKLLREIADKYEKQTPGVKIDIISPPIDSADAKITQMFMSKSGIDMMEVRDSTIAQYTANGWLLDLKPYVDAWNEKDTLSPAAYNAMDYIKGGEYMLPYGFYQRCLFYRKDLLEANNISVPTTWQELYDASVKLTDAGKTQYGYSFRGGKRGYQYADTMIWSYLGTKKLASPYAGYYLADGNGKTVFTTDEAKQALIDYKKFFENCSPKDSISWGFSEMVQGFVGGTCAFLLQDADTIGTVEKDLPAEKWDTAPFPIGPSGQAVFPNGFGGWGISSFCEHPKEAAAFLLFLNNAENNTNFAKNYGVIPIHTNAGEIDNSFSTGHFSVYTKYAQKPDIYTFATEPQMYKTYSEYNESVDEQYQKYLLGQMSVDDLLKYLDDYWTKIYKDNGQQW